MNTASLELCKKLYELSGWCPATVKGATATFDSPLNSVPAYDLGYLIRKLPPRDNSRNPAIVLHQGTVKWEASLGILYSASADTPEDALAKLALELFNNSILTKEEE